MIEFGSVPLAASLLAIRSAAQPGSPASWRLHGRAADAQYAASLINANLESRT